VRPLVLVIEVVGVLPQVDGQERPLVAVGQGVAVVRFLDRKLAALFGEPDPTAGEVARAAAGELLVESVEGAAGRIDVRRQVAAWSGRFGRERMPVKAVVPALRGVVEQPLFAAESLGGDGFRIRTGENAIFDRR